MDSTPHTIPATDGYPLGAMLWTAAGVPQGVVVMHPATGVPQRIYQAFAKFLAERGFHTITYDYRGIGASRPKSLRRFAARMRDWALLDAEGVMRWARARYPELPHLAVGHSVGGHAIGLCSADWDVAGVVQVACHTGNARFIRQRGERWRVDLILRGVGPLMARLIGYVPGKRMGLGEDLPTHTFKTDDGEIALKCPTEIAITDRREKELSDLGFIPLVHCKNTDYAAFFAAQSAQKAKKYDSDSANANAVLSAQLQYIFSVSRVAHYLKAMMRDKIGSFASAKNVETFLNRWISQYVLLDDNATQEQKAQFPLREASIQVAEVPGKPGTYRSVAFLRPHFQLDELSISLRLVADLPKSANS